MNSNRHFSTVLAGLGLIIAGCTASDNEFDQYLADYSTEMNSMMTSTAAHGTSIDAATELSVIATEEDSHYSDMQTLMDDMMGTSESLEQCDMMSSMDPSGMMPDMSQELEDHHAAMAAATTVDMAHSEEDSHQAAMNEMFMSMEEMESTMKGMSGSGMTCGGQSM